MLDCSHMLLIKYFQLYFCNGSERYEGDDEFLNNYSADLSATIEKYPVCKI